jgi:hypothetical protein
VRRFYAEERVLRSGEGCTQWRGFCVLPVGYFPDRDRRVGMQCNYTSIPLLLVNTLDQGSTQHGRVLSTHSMSSTRRSLLWIHILRVSRFYAAYRTINHEQFERGMSLTIAAELRDRKRPNFFAIVIISNM